MVTKSPDPADYLYLLSWHDVLERLDILVLEIRHLQVNIIHSLRAPVLYRPLRWEEGFLWGNWSGDELLEDGDPNEIIIELVDKWMCEYPGIQKNGDSGSSRAGQDHEHEGKGKVLLQELVMNLWNSNSWGRDQRRHYHLLAGLQVLKRQIFRDKLLVCRYALEKRLAEARRQTDAASEFRDTSRAGFLILRAGVMARICRYIEWLDNHQNAFSKAMDTGVQDHPRPSIERRRELGIYSDFLADRNRDILLEMRLLLSELGDKEVYCYTQTIHHRWRHDGTSRTVYLDDEVSEGGASSSPVGPPLTYRFVNTSYFMPERPDLQPVIAHEVAHCLLRDNLGDLGANALHSSGGSFAELVDDILANFNLFDEIRRMPRGDVRPKELANEVGADLLAASTKGFSYLYSLYLELVGHGLEHVLGGWEKRIELSAIYTGLSSAPTRSLLARQWYLRLRVVSTWLRSTHHKKISKLDNCLLDGVDQVCKEMNDMLNHALPWEIRRDQGAKWEELTDQICELIEASRASKKVRKWREKRSLDDEKPTGSPTGNGRKKGYRRFPRSTARLNRAVRKMLFELVFNMKQDQGRRFSTDDNGTGYKEFLKAYGLYEHDRECFPEDNEGLDEIRRRHFHCHLYDIPWQSAMLRAMDFIGCLDGQRISRYENQGNVLLDLHYQFPLGRELFSFALEYFIWHAEPATRRLRSLIDLIRDAEKACNEDRLGVGNAVCKELKVWIGKSKIAGIEDARRYLEKLKKGLKRRDGLSNLVRSISERESGVSAIDIAELPYYFDEKKHPEDIRILQRSAGYKLQELFEILKESAADGNSDQDKLILPLVKYLSIRSKDSVGGKQGKSFKEDFYGLIGDALVPVVGDRPNGVGRRSITPTILGRVSTAGTYHHIEQGEKNYYLTLDDVLKANISIFSYPYCPYSSFNDQGEKRISVNKEGKRRNRAQAVLGRYDLVLWGETHFLCRCPLPVLDSNNKRGEDAAGLGSWIIAPDGSSSDREESDKVWEERWPTFFTRREMALKLHLRLPDNDDEPPVFVDDNKGVIAFLAITLQRRPYRLDFLYRLLSAIRDSAERVCNSNSPQQTLESAASKVRAGDFAFLTDGWGDLVLAFVLDDLASENDLHGCVREKVHERLIEIFDLQSAIYQDFMVDRTELILANGVLGAVAKNEQFWKIQTRIRLMEDNSLSPSNKKIQSHIIGEANNWSNEPEFCKRIDYWRTPGRLDYTIDFEDYNLCPDIRDGHPCKYSTHANCFGQKIGDLISSSLIDRLDTTIGMKCGDAAETEVR